MGMCIKLLAYPHLAWMPLRMLLFRKKGGKKLPLSAFKWGIHTDFRKSLWVFLSYASVSRRCFRSVSALS